MTMTHSEHVFLCPNCNREFGTAVDYLQHLPCYGSLGEGPKRLVESMFSAHTVDKQVLTGDQDIDRVIAECIQIMSSKGHDYMAGTTDRLYNFRQAAADLGITMREVAYIYMWKHLSAIRSYCRTGEMKAEGVLSRITDAINYLLLLYKISLEEEKKES